MTEINFEEYKVTVKGHAGYAEPGQDIVCSAVSTLVQTLASTLKNMSHCLRGYSEQLESGEAVIWCRPKECSKKEVDAIYKTIKTGLKGVAKAYPDFVKII